MLPDLVERAAVELEKFEWFAASLTTQQKQPLILEPFQKELLTPTFAGVPVNVISLPKKNGKSSIVACYALWHLLTTHLADVIVVATSVKQSDVIFSHIRKYIQTSEMLQGECVVKPGFKEVRLRSNPLARIRVLASDPATLEGCEPSAALCDELGQHASSEPYAILLDGCQTRDGKLIAISNAPQDDESHFGQLRAKAFQLPCQEIRGTYKFFTNHERDFAYSEYSLEPDADITPESAKTANPASWISEDMLRKRLHAPGETLQRFKRFGCGIICRTEDTAISPEEWDALAEPDVTIPKGSNIYIGWDNAWRGPDTTALVPLWWKSDKERVFGKPTILKAPTDGMLDDRDILAAFLAFEEQFTIEAIIFDPNAGAAAFAQQLEREQGWKLIEMSQKGTTLARADVGFLEAIRQKTISHDADRTFRQHVLNAVERSVGTDGSWIFDRPKGQRVPTDALRAASMVLYVATAQHKKHKGVQPWFASSPF